MFKYGNKRVVWIRAYNDITTYAMKMKICKQKNSYIKNNWLIKQLTLKILNLKYLMKENYSMVKQLELKVTKGLSNYGSRYSHYEDSIKLINLTGFHVISGWPTFKNFFFNSINLCFWQVKLSTITLKTK